MYNSSDTLIFVSYKTAYVASNNHYFVFQVQPKVETADFPTYPQVPLKAPESEPVR